MVLAMGRLQTALFCLMPTLLSIVARVGRDGAIVLDDPAPSHDGPVQDLAAPG